MRVLLAACVALSLLTCSDRTHGADKPDGEFRKQVQRQLIQAKPGDVIELPAGRWSFARPLTMNKSGITLRGAGPDATILSFASQLQGPEGLTMTGVSDVTIENLAIEDSKGDALKANRCKDLTIRNVRIEWTRGPDERNGGYGLYPVQCQRVLIERSVVIGASDAGIYVGQSQDVVVRDNRVEFNVVGIEIENTTRADVYRNEVTNNTGGLLVINMPYLPIKFGRETRVYENRIYANNTANFAPPGNVIARVPAGTGFMVLAGDDVEFFENRVADNHTANAMIVSFAATGKPASAVGYDPYPQRIAIHHNTFSGGGDEPDTKNMPALRLGRLKSERVPDIVWDGVMHDAMATSDMQICVHDNGDAGFGNLDLRGRQGGIGNDVGPHRCTLARLAPVSWPALTDAE